MALNYLELKKPLALQNAYEEGLGGHVLGESGSGKSALLKELAIRTAKEGSEVVWIKAEHFSKLQTEFPNFAEILHQYTSFLLAFS